MANFPRIPSSRPKHGFVSRDRLQVNGMFIGNEAYFVHSGTLADIQGGTTGSIALNFDAYGIKLRRFECFHSGAASSFTVTIENATPNTGAFYDPRSVVVEYEAIPGSDNYSAGIDQIENLVAITDPSGSMYVKFKPNGAGNNTFKYLMFCEGIYVYIE